jgi:hypothetical protein
MPRPEKKGKILAIFRAYVYLGLMALHCICIASIYAQSRTGYKTFGMSNDTISPASALVDGWVEYRGTLGNQRIGVFLQGTKKKEFNGHYFYFRYLRDIALEGRIMGPREITLTENNSDGKVRGTFDLNIESSDTSPEYHWDHPLAGEVLSGVWLSAAGQHFPVRLEREGAGFGILSRYANPRRRLSDQAIERNIGTFYFGVIHRDKEKVARDVIYPFKVTLPNGKEIRIKNQAQFLQKYDNMFTPYVIKEIRLDAPHDLMWSSSDGGIMMSYGTVWFNRDGIAESLYAYNNH